MKSNHLLKLVLATLPIIGFTACNDGIEEMENIVGNQTIEHNIRSIEDAIDVASQAAKLFGHTEVLSRGTQNMRVHVISDSKSRSGATDTLLYVVDYGENNGFAVVCAPYGTEALLAVTESGDYSSMETIQNDGFQYYMAAAQNYAKSAASTNGSNEGKVELTPAFYTEYRLVHEVIEPKLEVKWGLSFPEGYYCSNRISGCVQVALAQIYSYLEEPKSLNLTYPERDVDNIQIDWTELKKHKESFSSLDEATIASHFDVCEASQDAHYILARICRELGFRNHATYGNNVTAAYDSYARTTSINLLENREISGFTYLRNDYDTLYNTLKDHICYIRGSSSDGGGHAWVVDGGKIVGNRIYTYSTSEKDPITGGDKLIRITEKTTTYFHFNWGWNGHCDGHFVAGVFDTAQSSDKIQIGPTPEGTNYGNSVKYFSIK